MSSVNREIRCDGCGAPASPEHLKRRLERLELATRYRPIHMECLVLQPAPPGQMEDYFYRSETNGTKRSLQAEKFFNAMMAAAGADATREKDEVALLAEFQRKGWYVAECCECPLEESGVAAKDVVERFAETVVKRTRLSYRPKRVALAAHSLEPIRKPLHDAGFGDVFVLRGV